MDLNYKKADSIEMLAKTVIEIGHWNQMYEIIEIILCLQAPGITTSMACPLQPG